MPPNDVRLVELAGAILDGTPVDWASAEAAGDATDLLLLDQLKLLASVAAVHRTLAPALLGAGAGDTPGTADGVMKPGTCWGHLRVIRSIGRGASGCVYLASDLRLDRDVALKLIPISSRRTDSHSTLIIEEGRLLARVRHPNVVTIYGADLLQNHIGLWMELVTGHTLEQILEEGRAFSPAEAVSIGLQLCKAVGAVHTAGLLHRDIKAHNVMLQDDGRIVLMDFGTGRELGGGAAALAGTPLYLAPELLSGADATVQSDVYSVGVLLFHVLTGSYPVRAESLHRLRVAHRQQARRDLRTIRADVSPRLARIIDRAISPRPKDRYQTVEHLAADLETLRGRFRSASRVYLVPVASTIVLAVWMSQARGPAFFTRHVPFAGRTAAVEEWASVSRPRSIAVLPFKPLLRSDVDDRLGLGMTEALNNQLSRIKTIRIEPLPKVQQFGAIDLDPLAAGRALGVDAVLQVHFQQTSTSVHVRSRLLRTNDGATLVTHEWHEPLRNILDVQSQLAESLANAFDPALTSDDRSHIRRLETTSPEAFRHYSFGRHHLELRNLERLHQAEREFREALKIDPDYARAHAALAHTLTQMVWQGGRKGADVQAPAKAAALKAIAIDESLALSHTALADTYHYFDYDPARAQREHLRAIELDDRDVFVLRGYAGFLMNMEAVDEALEVHQRSLELDPASPLSNRITAQMLYVARRYDECVAQCDRVAALDPEDLSQVSQWLGNCLDQQGNQRAAIEAWMKGRSARGNSALAERLTRAFATSGWEGFWRERLRLPGTQFVEVAAARAYAALGEVDEAMRALERGYESRSLGGFANSPQFDRLRSDPRFQALRVRVGLAEEIKTQLAAARASARVRWRR